MSCEFKCEDIACSKQHHQHCTEEMRVLAKLGDEYLMGVNKTNFYIPATTTEKVSLLLLHALTLSDAYCSLSLTAKKTMS